MENPNFFGIGGGLSMDFKRIFGRIEYFHKALGYDYNIVKDWPEQMQELRNITTALNQEVAELLDSFPWKPWRSRESQNYNLDNAKREVVDIIFFLVEFCEAAGITAQEIEEKFEQVMANNYVRIESGYNNKPEERR